MKTKFLLTISAAALLAFTAPSFAASDAAPAAATVDATAPATTQAVAPNAGTPAPDTGTSGGGDRAMTKVEGDEDKKADDAGDAGAALGPDVTASEPAPAADTAVGAAPAGEHEASADTHHTPQAPQLDWSFNGPFGTFDRKALQRGFQVYKQVCAACHSMNRVYYRNLAALGYNEAEIKSIAAEATVMDGPNDEGEMFERPGRPSDHFKSPFVNDQAARAANGGALPPDLSLIVRARADGANYVHAILTGYTTPPAGFVLNPGMNYNQYFQGHQIAMPQPLQDGSVTFEDGTASTIDQQARDLTTFLTWASEPVMEKRKQTGLKVMLFLFVFCGLMYATKRAVWRSIH